MKGNSELTNRQKEVLRLLASGLSNKQIAAKLNVSVKTIDDHRAKIMAKLNINNLPGLVKYAIRTGLTSIDR
jgi:DNA-binding NarL/FixJ family response regulator